MTIAKVELGTQYDDELLLYHHITNVISTLSAFQKLRYSSYVSFYGIKAAFQTIFAHNTSLILTFDRDAGVSGTIISSDNVPDLPEFSILLYVFKEIENTTYGMPITPRKHSIAVLYKSTDKEAVLKDLLECINLSYEHKDRLITDYITHGGVSNQRIGEIQNNPPQYVWEDYEIIKSIELLTE